MLLTGSYPFKGQTDRDVYKNILLGSLEIPRNVSPQGRLLIKRMLQKDFNKRPTCSLIKEDPWMNPNILEIAKVNVDAPRKVDKSKFGKENLN